LGNFGRVCWRQNEQNETSIRARSSISAWGDDRPAGIDVEDLIRLAAP
jgi:hypothetical protein